MLLMKFKALKNVVVKALSFGGVCSAGCLIAVSAHGQSSQPINLTPPGSVQSLPEGLLTRSQAMLRVSSFTVSATLQASGGYKMTGICDGAHKAKIKGRKNGTTGNNTAGSPAIMFEFEMICNQPDPTNPPTFAPLAGKPNAYIYNTNILLTTAATVARPGVSPGVWTINATQKGGTTAPVQDVVLPAITVTF